MKSCLFIKYFSLQNSMNATCLFRNLLLNHKFHFCATCNFISGVLCQKHPTYNVGCNGSLARYVKLGLAHAPGMPGPFSPPQTSKETASKRSRHASRHVRDARAVMHFGIANPRGGEHVPGIPGTCVTRNSMHLARGPLPDRVLDTCSWHNTIISALYCLHKVQGP